MISKENLIKEILVDLRYIAERTQEIEAKKLEGFEKSLAFYTLWRDDRFKRLDEVRSWRE